MFIFCKNRKRKLKKESTRILRLPEKEDKNTFNLQQKTDNLYDIDEHDENGIPPMHCKSPANRIRKVKVVSYSYIIVTMLNIFYFN